MARLARRLTIPLQGGLGNQLFELAAGLALASRQPRDVRFSDYWLEHAQAGETVRGLAIGGLLRPSDLVHDRVPRVGGVTDRLGHHHVVERSSADDALARVGRLTSVAAGYFQHLQYVEEAWPEIRTRFLDSDHAQLARLVESSPGDHGAVHYRLGDYLSSPGANKHHGATAPDYFAGAIRQHVAHGGPRRWRIVSDDPVMATSLLSSCDLPDGVTLEPAASASEWDDLEILATSRTCIISNSSFSWWAAYLGWKAHDTSVVAPTPWFAEGDVDEPRLFPDSWQRRGRTMLATG